uniref:RRM domain-containing protein n=1 Tax=Anopheles culicifacies TaxID=139723 RepID=A0A182M9N8_9DIPT
MGGLGGQGNSMAPFNQGGGAGGGNNAVGGGGGGGQNSVQPTTQLRSLVQQIQMAVQTGYLNPQILNQPLAPQTFLLLNQLLSSIKNSLSEMTLGKEHNNGPYLSGPPGAGGGTGTGGPTSQQSRLNQWKLPSMMDKDSNHDLTDFSRAPGSTAKSVGLGGNGGGGAGGMGGLGGLQSESTWSSGRAGMTDGWPDNASSDLTGKDWPSNQDSFSDLVPEFEPGKPWKGTQMKIEEDPTITPGSIARSPIASISVGSAKDSELFASSSKPSPTDSISLSSSTWSFNASSNNYSSSTSGGGMGKLGGASKNTWSDSGVTGAASDVWGASLSGGSGGPAVNSAAKTPRGPPPGLSSGKSTGSAGGGPGSNGWIQRTGHGQGGNWSGGGGASGTWYSTWLLLKNLTAQIDGSTLRTLCMQHGPLQNFHLYLNHGIALCKYLTREEASKAQLALNNCVLGNTTICAESPTDGEVQTILQHLGLPGQNGGNVGGGSSSGGGGQNTTTGAGGIGNSNMAQTWRSNGPITGRVTDTWGPSWSSSGGGSNLWTPLDGPTERGTPSNLNSFLPENLLVGELN